jgi:hypothetical protein
MFFKKFAWCLAVPIYAYIVIFGGSAHTKINLHIHTRNKQHRLLRSTHRMSIRLHAPHHSIHKSFKHLPVDMLIMLEDNLHIHALRFINAVAGDVLESFQFTLLRYWFATHETLYSIVRLMGVVVSDHDTPMLHYYINESMWHSPSVQIRGCGPMLGHTYAYTDRFEREVYAILYY